MILAKVKGWCKNKFRILRHSYAHPACADEAASARRRPGPLPLASAKPPAQPGSDGRGRMVLSPSADPTALETANDRSGCSLSRRTGEGQGEGGFVLIALPGRQLFLHKP